MPRAISIKAVLTNLLTMLIALYLFYESIYQIANWASYKTWLGHAPLLKQVSDILVFFIPVLLLILSCATLVRKYRTTSLIVIISMQFIFIGWIATIYLFTGSLFWPYHSFWSEPTWQQKMYMALAQCWIAWMIIFMTPSKTDTTKNIKINSAQIGSR